MASREAQFVILGLGPELFAVPVEFVREILDYAPPFALPEGPSYLLGLTDVRGRATPTLDLRLKLGLPAAEPTLSTRILVLDVPTEDRVLSLGFVADKVMEVAAFDEDKIEPAPDIGVRWRSDYMRGVIRRDSGFVVLFDLEKLLTSQDVAALPAERAA